MTEGLSLRLVGLITQTRTTGPKDCRQASDEEVKRLFVSSYDWPILDVHINLSRKRARKMRRPRKAIDQGEGKSISHKE